MIQFAKQAMIPDGASETMRWVSLTVCPEPCQRLVLSVEALLYYDGQD